MNEQVHHYVENLFREYEDNAALSDFKEEIVTNLLDRIAHMQKSGLTAEQSFAEAIAELGDITQIADDLSRQKRNEMIGHMYLSGTKVSLWHAIGYVLAGGIALFGITSTFITHFATDAYYTGVSSVLPFLVASGALFVFLGLTQETARNYAMRWERAIFYALAAGTGLFGIGASAIVYFFEERTMEAVMAPIIPFVIPSVCVLAFLLLTEKKRHKPWVIEAYEREMAYYKERYDNPKSNYKMWGMFSGALWIFTIALFITLGITIGFKYAWLVFLFAIAVESFIFAFRYK